MGSESPLPRYKSYFTRHWLLESTTSSTQELGPGVVEFEAEGDGDESEDSVGDGVGRSDNSNTPHGFLCNPSS